MKPITIKKYDNRKCLPGVTYLADKKKYRARCWRDGKQVYLGSYNSEAEAHAAYLEYLKDNPPINTLPEYESPRKRAKTNLGKLVKGKINAALIGTPWLGL